MSEETDTKKTRTILKAKAKPHERRIGLVLSLTGGKAQIKDMDNQSTIEMEIPENLKGKGIVEQGKKIPFLHHKGEYKIET